MNTPSSPDTSDAIDDGVSLRELIAPLLEHWKLLIVGPLGVGLLTLGIMFQVAPRFTARTTFLPPQQQQSAAAAALASLGGLGALAGAAGGRTPADQYVALMQSATVEDRLIDAFKLIEVYEVRLRVEARDRLEKYSRIAAGRKDGLISVEVEDRSPQRAAEIANRYVEELRRLTSTLAVTEAQQRRAFFDTQLKETRDKLTSAQQALQASGFSPGALRAEPKAAAEGYARLKAEVTASEVRLQTLRSSLVDGAAEVQQQQTTLSALRAQLAKLEQVPVSAPGPDYIGKYREFKYQETLFDLFARQYELARVDESREGALIQVVDIATAPERKSWPKRGLTAVVASLLSAAALAVFLVVRARSRRPRASGAN